MDGPPAQNSSKHILNILNNHCIGQILRRLPNLEDFLNASKVCTRFHQSAKDGYPSKFKWVDINRRPWNSNHISIRRVFAFLKDFGHLIHTIDWVPTKDRKCNREMINMISKFCGKTLKVLEMKSPIPNLKSPHFQTLHDLDLDSSSIEMDTPMKDLMIGPLPSLKQRAWFMRGFPFLESVTFYSVGKLSNEKLLEFISLNPQLKQIVIQSCGDFSPQIFKALANFAPDLEVLEIEGSNILHYGEIIITESILYLLALPNLKRLKFDCPDSQNFLLRKILGYGRPILKLEIVSFDWESDLGVYNSFLALAESRVNVRIKNFRKGDLPNDLLKANHNWLDIRF